MVTWRWQDLSPGSVEEAEEAEPDDEFKDAIEVKKIEYTSSEALLLKFLLKKIVISVWEAFSIQQQLQVLYKN